MMATLVHILALTPLGIRRILILVSQSLKAGPAAFYLVLAVCYSEFTALWDRAKDSGCLLAQGWAQGFGLLAGFNLNT